MAVQDTMVNIFEMEEKVEVEIYMQSCGQLGSIYETGPNGARRK